MQIPKHSCKMKKAHTPFTRGVCSSLVAGALEFYLSVKFFKT